MRKMTIAAGLITLLGWFADLCSVFALIATAGVAWREDVQASWPEVTATIEKCSVDLRSMDGRYGHNLGWWLRCQIGFRVGTDQIETKISSSHRGSRPSFEYPELMNQWANDHPTGSAVAVRYNPTNRKAAILAREYMPNGGPRTPNNLKVLLAFSIACVSLLIIAKLFRRLAQRPSNEA
jgi:hypothetical protein